MPWIRITLDASAHDPEQLSDLLNEAGAEAVTLEDGADQPVLETLPGETRLWKRTQVTGLFAADVDGSAIAAQIRQTLNDPELPVMITALEDQDWERVWLDRFQPMRFGQRLWVCPHNHTPPNPDDVTVMLDPGLAFGTGTHPTTALCLEWLDAHDLQNQTVIDYGCGSGILAIAAAKLGARQVWAVDYDPQALIATTDNAAANGVAERIVARAPEALTATSCDIVLANILAEPLLSLAPQIAQRLRPGGKVVLSGILLEQAADVMAKYETWFNMEPMVTQEGWVRLSGQRRAHAD